MMDNLRQLYQEVIVDHNRSPRNFHSMDHANCQANGFNPLCGDQFTVYLQIENDLIKDASFTGKGCAISVASASLMTDFLKGKTIAEALTLFNAFHDVITEEAPVDSQQLGKLTVLCGVKEFPSRIKCATLAWHALKAAINHQQQPVSTE